MSKNDVIKSLSENAWSFWCVGCNETHVINDAWDFNKDFENPTIKPSVLAWRDPNPNADPKHDPTGKYRKGFRCHSFITKGEIQYLTDCTHRLAGKTVRLLPVEKWRNS